MNLKGAMGRTFDICAEEVVNQYRGSHQPSEEFELTIVTLLGIIAERHENVEYV